MIDDAPARGLTDALGATVSDVGRAAPRDPLELAAGDHLGRYQLVDKLGAGAMGVVFRARDTALGRDVAIKVLARGRRDDTLAARLLREAQAMAQLRHDHLVMVHDVGEDRGHVYIAMELIGGGTLRRWLASGHGWRDQLAVVIAAGRGLAAAHDAGVVHRDFKPDNVLIDTNDRAKVADFGLACTEPGEHAPVLGTVALTGTGATLGTPAYMAPEQYAGTDVDARADQFALAVVAWEAVWGQRPFAGDDYPSLAAAVQAGAIRAPATRPRAPRLEAALRRALAVDRAARYRSVTELLDAIARAIRPRRAPWIAAGALIAIAAASVLVAAAWSSHRGGAAPASPSAASPSGGLSPDALDVVIAAHRTDVLGCLEDAELPAGTTEVELLLDVRPDGRVRSASFGRDESSEGDASRCLSSVAERWSFPAPGGAADVYLRYRFHVPRSE